MADIDDVESEPYDSPEEMIKRLTERSDDFEFVKIMVTNDLPMTGPQGQQRLIRNHCGIAKLASGRTLLLTPESTQALINSGILQRMRIQVEIVPREAR